MKEVILNLFNSQKLIIFMCLGVLPTNMSTYHQHAVPMEARMDLEFQVAVTCYMGAGDQILIPFKC